MFDDHLERALDDVYGDDEQAKSAARADVTAMIDHRATDATDMHGLIARKVWAALRRLASCHSLRYLSFTSRTAAWRASMRKLPPISWW